MVGLLGLSLLPNRWTGYAKRFGTVLKLALVPVSKPVYHVGSMVVRREELATDKPRTTEDLKKLLRMREQEVFLLRKKLADAERLRAELAALRRQIPDRYKLPQANAIGRSGDPAARTVEIDIGATSGVYRNDPVISDGYLVGRIANVGPTTSTVQFLTSPENLINAALVPVGSGTGVDLRKQPLIQLKPSGPDRLIEDAAPIDLPVEKGDVARLIDLDWPRSVHGMIVGVVVRVKPDPDRKLRKQIELRPPRPLNHLTRFIVIVQDRSEPQTPEADQTPDPGGIRP